MPALVAGIHVFLAYSVKTWMAATSPAMTSFFSIRNPALLRDLDSQRALDGLHAITLDDVADPHVAVILERHAAFLAGLHFLHFVLEALQGRELAFVNDEVVADQADIGAAFHGAVGDAAARDLADLGNVEDFQDLGVT